MQEDIANVIRHHRKQSGLSRQQLAEIAGVGKTVIYDIEQGKQSIRFDTLSKILSVLNIKLCFRGPLADEVEI